jgi:hypothetical protein
MVRAYPRCPGHRREPGRDGFALGDARLVELGPDAAVVTHRFSGRRGEDHEYSALMRSTYVRRSAGWRMASHQQTPLG